MCYVASLVGKAQGSVKDHHKDAVTEKDFISTEMSWPLHRGLGEFTGQGGYRQK